MDQRTEAQVEQWPSRDFSGGYAALGDLADESFSGAVHASGAWLFMVNGRVVGVFDGRMEAFADADGTVFDAPDAAPVLVFAMLETGGEQRGRYYTEDTPLSEVDEMLSGGGFAGYVALSENVLSGDYYVAYYGGASRSAAIVGASEELVTGEEAFEAAADEVGIFEVVEVDLDVQDVPEPEDESEASGTSAGASPSGAATDAADASPGESASEASPEPEPEPESSGAGESVEPQEGNEAAASPDAGGEPKATEQDAESRAEPAGSGEQSTASSRPAERAPADEPGGGASDDGNASGDTGRTGGDAESASDAERGDATGASNEQAAASAAREEARAASENVFSEEAEWRETNTVPALDPDESEQPADESGDDASGGTGTESASATTKKRERDAAAASRRSGASSGSTGESRGPAREQARERIQELEAAVEERDARIDDLEEQLAAAESERDDLREERDRLEAELESAREKLEAARERAQRASGGNASNGVGGGPALSPADALSQTNLFVRYDSKGEPTLDAVEEGADADAVNANLRVEHHTQFDAGDATVDDEPFEAFLEGSLEYAFVSWLVRRLPFEIRDAGHQTGLADLYDVLPEVDRAELGGEVEVEGDGGASTHSFDVVCRDKRGRPLVVAELNASREPVVEDQMTALVESATAVAGGVDGLGAGFYVTESFFKPDALSAATDASEGGILSRDKRESYVKVRRKTGYHLCLVEARDGSFHVSIPEL